MKLSLSIAALLAWCALVAWYIWQELTRVEVELDTPCELKLEPAPYKWPANHVRWVEVCG